MSNKKVKVFDFFSGCGGTSQGFFQSGMDIVFGIDYDKDAGETFKLNFPNAYFINSDIKKLDTSVVKEIIKQNSFDHELILFSGCAPCQPFSTQNKKKSIDDPRQGLLNEFSRVVIDCLPDFIFIENVPGLQKTNSEFQPFTNFLEVLHKYNYFYEYKVVPALWFGVPQRRERLILIASKHGKICLPKPTHDGVDIPYSTVKDWIFDLPAINAGETHPFISDHQCAKLSPLNLNRIKNTPEGGGRDSWPERLFLDCHKNHKGHSDVYGRLSWSKYSSTLTTKCISYSNGRFGHPEQNRALSIREAASLQTFPRTYKFCGSLQSKAKQIGNAVPPLISETVGKEIIRHINSL